MQKASADLDRYFNRRICGMQREATTWVVKHRCCLDISLSWRSYQGGRKFVEANFRQHYVETNLSVPFQVARSSDFRTYGTDIWGFPVGLAPACCLAFGARISCGSHMRPIYEGDTAEATRLRTGMHLPAGESFATARL